MPVVIIFTFFVDYFISFAFLFDTFVTQLVIALFANHHNVLIVISSLLLTA